MSLNQLKPGRAFVCLGSQAAGKGLEPALLSGSAAGARLGSICPSGLGMVLWQDGIPVQGALSRGWEPVPRPCACGENLTGTAEACCVQAVVRQCQEKTGTVALLGAVSAHWCGAGMLVSWKSWITAPGALWRWGRGAQPGSELLVLSAGLTGRGVWLLTAPGTQQSAPDGNAGEIHVYCQQRAMLGSCTEPRAFGPYICVVPGFR